MRKLLVAAALLMLAGCSPSPGSLFSRANDAWGTGTFPVANDGQAALYIVRDAGPARFAADQHHHGPPADRRPHGPELGAPRPAAQALRPPRLRHADQQRADHHRGARPDALPAGPAHADWRRRACWNSPRSRAASWCAGASGCGRRSSTSTTDLARTAGLQRPHDMSRRSPWSGRVEAEASRAGRTWRCPCRRRCRAWRGPSWRRASASRRAASSARARPRRRSDGRARSRRH